MFNKKRFPINRSFFVGLLVMFFLVTITCTKKHSDQVSKTGTETITDIDGNVYHTVKIGNQVWTVENLRTTRYNDSTSIPHVTDSASWANLTTPGYCYYNNTTNADSIAKFGSLYNWPAVDTKMLAPKGWHVPSDSEWTVLEHYLVLNGYNWDGTRDASDYSKIAKSLAAKTDWRTDTTIGYPGNNLIKNNSSSFSALPGGDRSYEGPFYDQGVGGFWWSATENGASHAWSRDLGYVGVSLYRHDFSKRCGYSVRLVRD